MSNGKQLPPAARMAQRRMSNGDPIESGQQSIASLALAHIRFKPSQRVLELACGTGWATRVAAKAVASGSGMAAGLDASPQTIAQARAASRDVDNALFVVGDPDEIPWRDEYFNVAFALQSFDLFRDPAAVLRELYRVLMPGGKLFVVGRLREDDGALVIPGSDRGDYVRLRCEEDYRHLLRAEGFEEIASTHLSDSTMPAGHCEGTVLLSAERL